MDVDMQQESTRVQLVSKQAVILSDTQDWQAWIQIKEDQAKRLQIWDYVNPDGPCVREFAEEMREPVEPKLSDYVKEAAATIEGRPPQKSDL